VLGDLNTGPENGEGADNGLTTAPSAQPAPMPFYNAGFTDIDRDCNRFINPENVSATITPECTLTQPSSSGGPNHKFDYVFVRLLVSVDEPSSGTRAETSASTSPASPCNSVQRLAAHPGCLFG